MSFTRYHLFGFKYGDGDSLESNKINKISRSGENANFKGFLFVDLFVQLMTGAASMLEADCLKRIISHCTIECVKLDVKNNY